MGFRFRVLGWSLGFRIKDLGFMPPGGYATGVQCRVVCFRIFRLQAAPVPANLLLSGSYSNWILHDASCDGPGNYVSMILCHEGLVHQQYHSLSHPLACAQNAILL